MNEIDVDQVIAAIRANGSRTITVTRRRRDRRSDQAGRVGRHGNCRSGTLTNDERIEHLRTLIPFMQKERSNALEACDGDEELAAWLSPWLWGDQALLPRLVEWVDRGTIDESRYRNVMWIINRHMPVTCILEELAGKT